MTTEERCYRCGEMKAVASRTINGWALCRECVQAQLPEHEREKPPCLKN